MNIIDLIPKGNIYDVDMVFDLLRKTTLQDYQLLNSILPNVNQKDWGEGYSLINNNESGDVIDLIFQIDEYPVMLYNTIEFVDEAEKSTLKNITNYIEFLKDTYKISNVYYSNALSIKNTMLFLMYLKESLEQLQMQLELSHEDMVKYFKGKTFVLGVGRTGFENENNNIYLNNEEDPLPIAFIQMVNLEKIKEEFFQNFKKNKITQNNFLNAQLFAKFLEDNIRTINDLNLNALNQYDFLFEMNDWIVNYLDLEDSNFNDNKNSFVYQQYKESLLKTLEDYNFKNYLENKSFKNQVFSLSYMFKHIVRKKYVVGLWKDMFLIEQLTKSLVAQGNSYNEYEIMLDDLLFNKNLLEKMKEIIVDKAILSSFLGFLEYYRNDEGNIHIELPTIEEERMLEKFFWEENLSVFKQ